MVEAELPPEASGWFESGAIFSVAAGDGRRLFPAFQFDQRRRPRPEFAPVIRLFRERGASDWQIALWLTGRDPWLRGRPIDRMETPDTVLTAAQRALDPVW